MRLTFSFFCAFQFALAIPVLNPILEVIQQVTSGKGLIEGTFGALEGALGQEATYDYVVVGGGTAGNAIGVRLAEAGHSVAIIEAGAYYELGKPVLGTTPAGDIIGIGSSILDSDLLVDWGFVTEPQSGANNRKVHYARGKALGGSSALNFMIYQRGTLASYEQWAEDVGDDSYTFDKILPYFERSVNFTAPNTETRLGNATTLYNEDVFSSNNPGPVSVSYTNYVSPWATWLEKAMHAIGIKQTQDFNSGNLMGAQYCSVNVRPSDQTRSTSGAYVNSAINNKNLKVYLNTLAKRILFGSNNTATGVEVSSGIVTYKIHASKEVILSAGAFQSPQLLMVSGIGPASTLNEFDIDVRSELPGVGQNMWDHIMFGPAYEVQIQTLDKVLHDPLYLAEALAEYITNHTGVLTSNVIEFIGWEKLSEAASYRSNFSDPALNDLASFPSDWPEVEWISGNGYIGSFWFPALQQPLNDKQYATILGALVAPTSRGNVTIKSTDTSVLPSISPNWLTTKTDQELAIAMYKRMRETWHTQTLQEIVIGEEYWPGKEVSTDEEILSLIQDTFMTVWHAACTCKMGKRNDRMAVVDNKARVYGVGGLRVVDASALPLLPPGHPTSSIYMLAEKIAQSIIDGD
ncbi:GMC oxidoreductase [Aplosporella prunicola CBS 121167]|uniref:GMC oxidoreductase n=1 Tax=Aplosporella prunicola CBS 121167 TaxID=1176127 RepID=A0A6A6BA29_9PEZI|nr:GMC oxidoreductase [Aplosporella prunicola CBS 121167]KAF2140428.1 GMC oxidoreductase [Aplosporella prunicola CBS 121167]